MEIKQGKKKHREEKETIWNILFMNVGMYLFHVLEKIK